MADLKDKQIRLVGSQNFAYATGSSYTQGHVHFTTDEHGSIVVNGKVYGTTDASYVYVGSENIPTYVANTVANTLALSYAYTDARISQLHENTIGEGKFVYRIEQTNGYVSAYKDTLQSLVTVDNSEAKAYAPKGTNEKVKFIKSFEIEGDTIIPKYDYFANNLPTIPSITVTDNNTGYYLPEFSANGHTITVTNGAQVVSYNEFSEHLDDVAKLHQVVNTFFGDLDNYDTNQLKSYIDTLAEIQEAFKNSYAEGIANSVNNIKFYGNNTNTSYHLRITYTTNGNSNSKETAYVDILYGTDTTYGLVKYDDRSIKKNTNGQLYVNGELTDTKYSLNAANHDGGAHVKLVGTDGTATTVQFKGTGIATISYSSTDKAIKIHVPETVVNYNHHSTVTGRNIGKDIVFNSAGETNAYKFISEVSLSADGKLSYSYITLTHQTSFNEAYVYTGPQTNSVSNGSIVIPKLVFNAGGHLTAYENITISGIARENHTHDEFVWL